MSKSPEIEYVDGERRLVWRDASGAITHTIVGKAATFAFLYGGGVSMSHAELSHRFEALRAAEDAEETRRSKLPSYATSYGWE